MSETRPPTFSGKSVQAWIWRSGNAVRMVHTVISSINANEPHVVNQKMASDFLTVVSWAQVQAGSCSSIRSNQGGCNGDAETKGKDR